MRNLRWAHHFINIHVQSSTSKHPSLNAMWYDVHCHILFAHNILRIYNIAYFFFLSLSSMSVGWWVVVLLVAIFVVADPMTFSCVFKWPTKKNEPQTQSWRCKQTCGRQIWYLPVIYYKFQTLLLNLKNNISFITGEADRFDTSDWHKWRFGPITAKKKKPKIEAIRFYSRYIVLQAHTWVTPNHL